MILYWVDGDYLGIADYSSTDGTFTNLTNEIGLNIRVNRITKADTFVLPSQSTYTNTQESNLPEDYHESLVYFALKKLYEKNPKMINLAQYFRNEYNMLVKEGKKESFKRRQSTGRIIPADY